MKSEDVWIDTCIRCGCKVRMTLARAEVQGKYCDRCSGWPFWLPGEPTQEDGDGEDEDERG